MKSRRSLLHGSGLGGDSDDMDPMGFLINLFDVALVFALALMIALVSNLRIADMLTAKDFTVVKNPGQPNMEIITREGEKSHDHSIMTVPLRACSLASGPTNTHSCSAAISFLARHS